MNCRSSDSAEANLDYARRGGFVCATLDLVAKLSIHTAENEPSQNFAKKKRAVAALVSKCFGKFWYKVFFMYLGQGKTSALFPVLPVAGWASKNKRVQKNMQSVPRESISALPRHQEFAKKNVNRKNLQKKNVRICKKNVRYNFLMG